MDDSIQLQHWQEYVVVQNMQGMWQMQDGILQMTKEASGGYIFMKAIFIALLSGIIVAQCMDGATAVPVVILDTIVLCFQFWGIGELIKELKKP